MEDFQISPVAVYCDYIGEIKVMTSAHTSIQTREKEQRIIQLLLVPVSVFKRVKSAQEWGI